jgi:hypothetical protein
MAVTTLLDRYQFPLPTQEDEIENSSLLRQFPLPTQEDEIENSSLLRLLDRYQFPLLTQEDEIDWREIKTRQEAAIETF